MGSAGASAFDTDVRRAERCDAASMRLCAALALTYLLAGCDSERTEVETRPLTALSADGWNFDLTATLLHTTGNFYTGDLNQGEWVRYHAPHWYWFLRATPRRSDGTSLPPIDVLLGSRTSGNERAARRMFSKMRIAHCSAPGLLALRMAAGGVRFETEHYRIFDITRDRVTMRRDSVEVNGCDEALRLAATAADAGMP